MGGGMGQGHGGQRAQQNFLAEALAGFLDSIAAAKRHLRTKHRPGAWGGCGEMRPATVLHRQLQIGWGKTVHSFRRRSDCVSSLRFEWLQA